MVLVGEHIIPDAVLGFAEPGEPRRLARSKNGSSMNLLPSRPRAADTARRRLSYRSRRATLRLRLGRDRVIELLLPLGRNRTCTWAVSTARDVC